MRLEAEGEIGQRRAGEVSQEMLVMCLLLPSLPCFVFLLTSMDSITSILKASGFQSGSASIVRGVQRTEERQVVIVLSHLPAPGTWFWQ